MRDLTMDTMEGSEEDIPVRERTCLLFARAWDSGAFPIVAGSNPVVEVIVKGVERSERIKDRVESDLYARVE
jgi:hypothetical protein